MILLKAHVSAYNRADGTHVVDHERHAGYARLFKPSLGMRREDMPQIPSGVKAKFLQQLRDSGVSVEPAMVSASTLKPTQANYNAANMDHLSAEAKAGRIDSDNPCLVSSDGRVLDGHHRWAVAAMDGHKLSVIKIGMPIERLLQVAEKFNVDNGIERRSSTGTPDHLAKSASHVLFFKACVGPYMRGGKMVNMAGYQGRDGRAAGSPEGQLALFPADPPPPPKPNPYKGKDPVLDTPDLFTGLTPRGSLEQNTVKQSESNAKLIEKEQNAPVNNAGKAMRNSDKELSADERNAIAKDQVLFSKYGNAGEGSRAVWKEAARSGKMDHLWAEHQSNVKAQEEAEKAQRRAKNESWREKNLPRLQAEAQRRRDAEAAKRLEEDRQREAQRQAAERDKAAGGTQRIYLRVPFESKDAAKQLGARWDADRRQWFYAGTEMPAGLKRWAPAVAAPAAFAASERPKDSPRDGQPEASSADYRDRLPTTGRVSENDPSIYGEWLLGREGEPWAVVRKMAPPPRKQASPMVLLSSPA